MSKVFKSGEFIEKLKWIVNDVPNYYHSEAGTWCNYNWNNDKFMMDCVVSIKGLLWGFRADKNAPHGGGVYLANGVADFGANQGIDYCEEVSSDFHNLTPGEYLCMAGTGYEHAGVYLGNGKVFECTTGWGVNRCIISEIDANGGRWYDGARSLVWTRHGKLIYIDYEEAQMKYKVGDVVDINGVYVSSNSTEKLTPAIKKGTITKIVEGARNPYLLDNGNIGWVNDECIVEPEPIDYQKKYEEEVEKNKLLTITNNNLVVINKQLQEKIDKAIKELS